MRVFMLCIGASVAAMTIAAAPAQAERWRDSQFVASPNGSLHRGGPPNFTGEFEGDRKFRQGRAGHREGDRKRRHRGRDRNFDDDGVWVSGWAGEWQGDSAWRANGYNDWWHERPHRAFPRWMSNNQSCERIWWGGGGWRC